MLIWRFITYGSLYKVEMQGNLVVGCGFDLVGNNRSILSEFQFSAFDDKTCIQTGCQPGADSVGTDPCCTRLDGIILMNYPDGWA